MSYADAAASSGPTGAEKLPKPAVHPERDQVETEIDRDYKELKSKVVNAAEGGKEKASELKSKAETKGSELKSQAEKTAHDLKSDAKDKLSKLEKDGKEALKDGKKKLGEFEQSSKNAIDKVYQFIREKLVYIDNNLGGFGGRIIGTTSYHLTKFYHELANPVVLVQSIVGLVGLSAGYIAYKDRYRINTDNSLVIGIHASVLTGLILTDKWLFNKYYPKFKQSDATIEAKSQKNAKVNEAKARQKIEQEKKNLK